MRRRNRRRRLASLLDDVEDRAPDVERYQPAEIVYLLAEVQAGGRIHEIGSRAQLLRAERDEVTLELGGAEHSIVSCPSWHVRRHTARERGPVGFVQPPTRAA